MGRSRKCPRCGSKDVLLQDTYDNGVRLYVCSDCDYEFDVGGSRRKNNASQYEQNDEPNDSSSEYEPDK